MLLTLSHGQASVERGFSVNKDLSTVNMHEKTIVAQRRIYDGVENILGEENKGNLSKINIDKDMLNCCRSSRMKYEIFLKEERRLKIESTVQKEKKDIASKIDDEKELQLKWNRITERLYKEADLLAVRAEKENKMSLLVDSNETRKRICEYDDRIKQSKAKIQKLQDNFKKL